MKTPYFKSSKFVTLSISDKKTPKEASQLFHDIIKASVSPKPTGAAKRKEVKPKPKADGGNGTEGIGKIMAGIDDMFPKRESVLYNSSQQVRDEVDRQDKIQREKISINLQVDLTKRLQDLEVKYQKQVEIDRQERAKERISDRRLVESWYLVCCYRFCNGCGCS